jgi:hypothetical protein
MGYCVDHQYAAPSPVSWAATGRSLLSPFFSPVEGTTPQINVRDTSGGNKHHLLTPSSIQFQAEQSKSNRHVKKIKNKKSSSQK